MLNGTSINAKIIALSSIVWAIMAAALLSASTTTVASWILAAAGLAVAIFGGVVIARFIATPIETATQAVEAIIDEKWTGVELVSGSKETNKLLSSLKLLHNKWQTKWNNLTQKSKDADRIRFALDSVTANVMLADHNFNIIYANNAVLEMLRDGQSDIRKELPGFDVTKVVG